MFILWSLGPKEILKRKPLLYSCVEFHNWRSPVNQLVMWADKLSRVFTNVDFWLLCLQGILLIYLECWQEKYLGGILVLLFLVLKGIGGGLHPFLAKLNDQSFLNTLARCPGNTIAFNWEVFKFLNKGSVRENFQTDDLQKKIQEMQITCKFSEANVSNSRTKSLQESIRWRNEWNSHFVIWK